MKIICLVGQCYSGKSHFIEHYLKRMFPCSVIHLGEHFRQKGFDGVRVDSEVLADMIKHLLGCLLTDGHLVNNTAENMIVLDNAFKDVEQADAVLKELDGQNVSVMWLCDKRSYVDFKKRGRNDDTNIEQKRKLWEDNSDALYQYLIDRKVDIIKVYNTDDGFLLE